MEKQPVLTKNVVLILVPISLPFDHKNQFRIAKILCIYVETIVLSVADRLMV